MKTKSYSPVSILTAIVVAVLIAGIVNAGTSIQNSPARAGSAVVADAPLSGSGTTASHLVIAASSGSVPGSMSAANFTKLGGFPADFPTGITSSISSASMTGLYVTPEIDFTATSTKTITLVPVGPAGTYPVNILMTVYLTVTTGALSTAPTWQAGNDAAESNFFSSVTPSLTAPFGTGAPVRAANPATLVTGVKMTASTTAVTLKITAGATGTGGFVLKGRFITQYAYAPQ